MENSPIDSNHLSDSETDLNSESGLWRQIHDSIEIGDHQAVADAIAPLSPVETARLISRVSEQDRVEILTLLNPKDAADVVEDLPESQASDLMEVLTPENAASIVHELPNEQSAELLRDMPAAGAEAILDNLSKEEADITREMIHFEPDTAGALMSPDILSFHETQTVREVFQELELNREKYAKYDVLYAYVTRKNGELRGVLQLRNLVLSNHEEHLSQLMIQNPLFLKTDADLETMIDFFDDHHFLGVPVVHHIKNKLVGVLDTEAVKSAKERRASSTFLKFSGIIGGEELRSLPLKVRSLRRLAFLAPNILLNLLAASVIAQFQDTLQAVIVLAVFLPIISDMSGCSGNQAVAVSIRELSLGLIRPSEVWRVFHKESLVGLINGFVLGIVLGLIAGIWKDNVWLGLVVGGALMLNTIISVSLGGLVPLLLKRFKVDPALASGPILTTVTDMCGFFLVLSFASALLDKL